MGMNWCVERLIDVIDDVNAANEEWDAQCYYTPTEERTKKVLKRLKDARRTLDKIISLVERWGT